MYGVEPVATSIKPDSALWGPPRRTRFCAVADSAEPGPALWNMAVKQILRCGYQIFNVEYLS